MIEKFSVIFVIVYLSISSALANNITLFEESSLADILAQRENRPFILVIWSIDCEPCMKELELLSRLHTTQIHLDVVLISTDGPEQLAEVGAVLHRFAITDLDNWLFANSHSPRLRYQIDKQWYGELPRAYFYLDATTRLAHSGALTYEQIDRWGKLKK
ncbi:MAG: TlpA family protein disulfide reductase [Gammaproteobacteria bacterium]|nr:TlpA family protein disulfide reductase [Gammaproteobacteria bacterium]